MIRRDEFRYGNLPGGGRAQVELGGASFRRSTPNQNSLGVLSAPVVGVIASVLALGERPSVADSIGFALMLAASACVLLAPNAQVSQDARRDPTLE